MEENRQAGPISVVQHYRKTLLSRTKENHLVIQIQKGTLKKFTTLIQP